MRSSLALTACVALAAGAASAGVVALWLAPTPAASTAASLAAPIAGDVTLDARFAELERRLADIELRQRMLAEQPLEPERAPAVDLEGYVTRSELEELLRKRGGEDFGVEAAEDTLTERVAQALDRRKRDESARILRDKQARRRHELDDSLQRVSAKLELTPAQSYDLRNVLLQQFDREDALRVLWEQGADDATLGERKRSDGEVFSQDLARILTPEQLERFWPTYYGGASTAK